MEEAREYFWQGMARRIAQSHILSVNWSSPLSPSSSSHFWVQTSSSIPSPHKIYLSPQPNTTKFSSHHPITNPPSHWQSVFSPPSPSSIHHSLLISVLESHLPPSLYIQKYVCVRACVRIVLAWRHVNNYLQKGTESLFSAIVNEH